MRDRFSVQRPARVGAGRRCLQSHTCRPSDAKRAKARGPSCTDNSRMHRCRILPEMAVDLGLAFDSFTAPLNGFRMKTYLPKVNLQQRKWHVIDADGAVLGRLAVQVAD